MPGSSVVVIGADVIVIPGEQADTTAAEMRDATRGKAPTDAYQALREGRLEGRAIVVP